MNKTKNISDKAQLIKGIGASAWFTITKENKIFRIERFSTEGELSSYQKIASEIPDNSCIVLGGFQKGHFSDSVQNEITNLYSVGNESFEGHVVTSRILYEYEKTIFM